eukprot:TRINITY_DN13404_c0_g2_i1.p1 TRINITY_DN13404_c0_g2~~TRINITY_DN13404_c0_g2_i1.p1  ORF type:complete len:899 (-),score=251.91 TRINITY_DN13404_c0_g2_i1:432-3128(-)
MSSSHFAASWLRSLSTKLESLAEWSFASSQSGATSTHRNLFREFFSAPFQKTLALVDEKKKEDFLSVIEKNLYKFDPQTQQFPLGCLCALLKHGKDAAATQEKIAAWVDFLLDRLVHAAAGAAPANGRLLSSLRGPSGPADTAREVALEMVEEVLSAPFQRLVPLMRDPLRERLADGLGEHCLPLLDQETQQKLLDGLGGSTGAASGEAAPASADRPGGAAAAVAAAAAAAVAAQQQQQPGGVQQDPSSLPLLLARIEALITKCTQELNTWLSKAPRFPATPLALADALARAEHPLVRFFTSCRAAQKKEAFLLAMALSIQALQTRFRWMCAAEPVLERLGPEMQRRLFFVEGQGAVMESWLASRLKKYNGEAAGRIAALMAQPGAPHLEKLRSRLELLFPPEDSNLDEAWAALEGPSEIGATVLTWLGEQSHGFYCPSNALTSQTLLGLFQRLGRWVEVDVHKLRVRLAKQVGPSLQAVVPADFPPPPPPPPAQTGYTPFLPPAHESQKAEGAAAAQALVLHSGGPSSAPAQTTMEDEAPADNLVDLLINEELASLAPEHRASIQKLKHAVYRIGTKEATFHTLNGSLFIYRVGDRVRHMPLKTLLAEEGFLASSDGGLDKTGGPAVDNSAVARIAQLSMQISTGETQTTSASDQAALPFGLGRPAEANKEALMSKRVEAATRAAEVAKQAIRRSVNFDDEKLLRTLLKKGFQKDQLWQDAYEDYCNARKVQADLATAASMDKKFIATFVEQNIPNYINSEWARKVLNPTEADKKEKKEKKDRKKEKKDKNKRKASESSGSDAEGTAATGAAAADAQLAPAMKPPVDRPPHMMAMQPAPMHHGIPGMPGMPSMYGVSPHGMHYMYSPHGMAMAAPESWEDHGRSKKRAKKEKDKSKR